jgi:pimeloyl-ACP methyl ester carboxylesterase
MDTMDGYLSVNDVELHYELAGRGEPLLLLHGMTGCSQDWRHANGGELAHHYRLIMPDARGHGRSTNPGEAFSHRQCALDVLALLDHLELPRCGAIGVSMGGNTLLHLAQLAPERLVAMVIVSAVPYFPEQARRLMRAVPLTDQPPSEWAAMRERHRLGDRQIEALWRLQRDLAESYDDMSFTPPQLSRIRTPTRIVFGDRDPLYPVELGVELYRSLPNAELSVLPHAGHAPVFLDAAAPFVRDALAFFARVAGG